MPLPRRLPLVLFLAACCAAVPDFEDAYYPTEEVKENATAFAPTVLEANATTGTCILQSGSGESVHAHVGDLAFGIWSVLSVLESGAVVMERRFDRWALLVYVASHGEITRLRKPLGHLNKTVSASYNFTSAYYNRAAADPNDYIGTLILNESEFREASFLTAAQFLPPLPDYTVIGDVRAPVKAVVTMNGKVKRTDGANEEPVLVGPASAAHSLAFALGKPCESDGECGERSYCDSTHTCQPGGTTVFSAESFLGLPEMPYESMQSGVIGGHLRIASVGCFDKVRGEGFELAAIGPLRADNDTILIAVRKYSPLDHANAPYTYVEVSLNRRRCVGAPCKSSPAKFWAAVLEHSEEWAAAFVPGMRVHLPSAERRQTDTALGVLVAASTVWIGDRPNYGTGGDYWRSSPPAASMTDTSGIAGSYPLTTLALDHALLQYGVFGSALAKIGFYLETFIFPNGTVDMGHWKDEWADGGEGQYNCTYPDGLSDHGRILELFADAVRFTGNLSFMQQHLPPVLRIGEYLLQSRREAVARFPRGDPRQGMILGPAEHDTCEMGRGSNDAIVDGQYMNFYFSVSFWHWRGMVELSSLLLDFPQGGGNISAFAHELRGEAERFKADIDAAVERSVVRGSNGSIVFVPAAVVPANVTATPYASMTSDTLASYSNFRYYSEMLSSGALSDEAASALMNFRETHGGCLSGMTRYTDHLDDMPAIGYALSSLSADRIERYLLLLYGHMANYGSRGSFFTTEQQSLYQLNGSSHWRASLGEIQADFCVPSQTLVASMTAMQLVFGERDAPVVWLARAAPRRWYRPGEGFGAENGPTRWGNVSFAVNGERATLSLGSAPSQLKSEVTVKLRLRDPAGDSMLDSVALDPGSDCTVAMVDRALDVVVLKPLASTRWSIRRCSLRAHFR